MTSIEKIMNKLLFPELWIVLLSVPVTAAGLTYVFAFHHQNEWTAYIIYVFSALSLMWVSSRTVHFLWNWKKNTDAITDRIPFIRRYMTDAVLNTELSLYRSLVLNVLYVLVKLIFAICYRSIWFGTLACYYFLMAVIRFSLLHHNIQSTVGADILSEWKRYRKCGIFLLVINTVLTVMVILCIRKNEGFHYPGYLIYIMAMYAFYSIIMAAKSVIRYRRYRSPLMSSVRVLQLTSALVSLFALETAMLTQFGTDKSLEFRNLMTGCTGGGVCIIILCIAVYMVYHADKEIKLLGLEEKQI